MRISLVWVRFRILLDQVSFQLNSKNLFANFNLIIMLITELFESGPRPAAMALGSLSSWTCNFIIGMAFPSLQSAWGAFVFLPFAVVCFALVALLKFYLPETRGRNSSEVVPLVRNGFRSRPLLN